MLVTDEIIDEGIIVHLDSNIINDRIKMRDPNDGSTKKIENKAATNTNTGSVGGTFSSLFGFAKSSLQKTLNLG